jgi:hypothetical protein
MARKQTDLLSKIADVGEDAIQRMTDVPGATKLLEMANGMRERIDDLQKRMRGLDVLEQRVKELERRVDELSKPGKSGQAALGSKEPATRAKPATKTRASGQSRTRAKKTT